MGKDNYLKWDYRFMGIAKQVSSWSKNNGIAIGTVIVNQERRIISTGYNGLPKKISDDLIDSEYKRYGMIHAEINAILNAVSDLAGSTMYQYGLPPCGQCAAAIIQSDIRRLVLYIEKDTKIPSSWLTTCKYGYEMLKLANIKIEQLKD